MKMESLNTLRARRDAKLKELSGIGIFIGGSLASVKVRCGNPNCRCARGERHEATILCKKVRGKSTSIHVPRGIVEEVKAWSREHRRLKRLVMEISGLGERIIRLHVKTGRASARNRSEASGKLPE
jgi:hypothetical protein